MNRKSLKLAVFNEYMKVFKDEKFCERISKKTSNMVELHNGMIYVFDTPKIKTSFCFGWDYTGNDGDSTYNEANRAVSKTLTDGGKIFMQQNLRDIEDTLSFLKNKKDNIFLMRKYVVKECNICEMQCASSCCVGNTEAVKATDEDVKKLIAMFEEEREKFTKRLNTYLKRYGTSKLRSWSYWQSA